MILDNFDYLFDDYVGVSTTFTVSSNNLKLDFGTRPAVIIFNEYFCFYYNKACTFFIYIPQYIKNK